LTVFKDFV